ncbi:MAG TPA: hypothetical protein VK104_01405 [Burkholderiaceae bacterium]|nr:hypothetical protein [Burkholderiaceae bacterium]
MTEQTLHQDAILNDSLERDIMHARLNNGQTISFVQFLRHTLRLIGRGLVKTVHFAGELAEDIARARAASERFSRSWW